MPRQITKKNTLLFSTSGDIVADDVITTKTNVLVNPKTKAIEFEDIGNGAVGNKKSVTNEDYVTADFTVEVNIKASGAKGTAPEICELFKASGLSEVITDDESAVYTPASSFVQGEAKAYLDGSRRDVTGIAGDFSIAGKIGEIATASFSLKGFTTLDETTEENPSVTLDSNTNLKVTSITAITVGGDEIDLVSFDFAFGAEIQETYALNTKEFNITDYKPTIKVKAIKTKGNSTHWAELRDSSKKEIVITLGAGDGGVFELKASYCSPVDVSESDDSGKISYERTWSCENKDGGDNFSITYK